MLEENLMKARMEHIRRGIQQQTGTAVKHLRRSRRRKGNRQQQDRKQETQADGMAVS